MSWTRRLSCAIWSRASALCSTTLVLGHRRVGHVLERDLDRRERRAQIVADRREERRRQLRALVRGVGGLPLREHGFALQRDGDDAGDGFGRAGFERARPDAHQADRTRAKANRHQHELAAVDGLVTAVHTRARVELEHAFRGGQRAIELMFGDFHHGRAALGDVPPAVRRRHANLHGVELEAARHVPRDRADGGVGFGRHQDVAADVEQARQFPAPLLRLACACPGRGRQLTGDDAHDEERAERDPVGGIGDGKGPVRREEEVVHGKHRRD